jgi:hypothetical protein
VVFVAAVMFKEWEDRKTDEKEKKRKKKRVKVQKCVDYGTLSNYESGQLPPIMHVFV